MRLGELARLVLHGGADLLAMSVRGELRPRHVWVAAGGARRFLELLDGGAKETEPAEMERRLGRCGKCPKRRGPDGGMPAAAMLVELTYCGRPFEPAPGDPVGTCGCLLGGKTAVEDEGCEGWL